MEQGGVAIQPEVVRRRAGIDIRAHLEENTGDLEVSILRSYMEQRCTNQGSEGRNHGRTMFQE